MVLYIEFIMVKAILFSMEGIIKIQRNQYLQKIINRMHNGMVKVVTGIRRSGKSYLLLNLFYRYLIQSGVQRDHILIMEFDRRENRRYRNPDKLLGYLYGCECQ